MILRLLTYNIHKCIGGIDRRYQPGRIAEVIRHYEPDVVLLQEVDEGAKRSREHRQVEVLGDLLGYRHRFWHPTVMLRGGGHYGNAILSRFPFRETGHLDLTIPPKKKRSALHVRIRVRVGRHTRTLHVYNLHLGLSGIERGLQLGRFLRSHSLGGLHQRSPVIVAGDFNDVYGTIARKILAPAGFRTTDTRMATFPAYAPIRALDSVYLRGDVALIRTATARLDVATRASDHLPLVVDIELK